MTENQTTLPEPLRTILSTYFDVGMFWHSFPSELLEFLRANPVEAAEFKQQFAAAFTGSAFSVEEYRRLTNQPFGSVGELYRWLHQRWADIYGDEPIPGDD